MRKLLIGLVMGLLLISVTYAEDILRPTGYEAITVDNTVGGKALTVTKYFTAATSKVVSDYAIIVVESAPVRFTVDGTTVTSTVGTPLQVGQPWVLAAYEELQKFRVIRTGDISGSLKVIYYKRYRQ